MMTRHEICQALCRPEFCLTLRRLELDRPHPQIRVFHDDPDRISDPERPPGKTAVHFLSALIEYIVIVREIMYSDKPFYGIRQLHIDAPGCDLGNASLKRLPDMREHILGFL